MRLLYPGFFLPSLLFFIVIYPFWKIKKSVSFLSVTHTWRYNSQKRWLSDIILRVNILSKRWRFNNNDFFSSLDSTIESSNSHYSTLLILLKIRKVLSDKILSLNACTWFSSLPFISILSVQIRPFFHV